MLAAEHPIHILVVDDEIVNRENIAHVLTREGYQVETAHNGLEAVDHLGRTRFDLVITDLRMAEMDGMQLMETVKKKQPDAEVIIITGFATVDSAVDAMLKGAFYYLPKPFKIPRLQELVEKALEKTRLRREVLLLKQQINGKRRVQFIGQNPAILRLKDDIAEVAQLDCHVLITGETGTGKELVASTIHELSPRANKRFLPINCGALSEGLMLNELFGHEKEAFTGATGFRMGLLESAEGGVILLDEIGEMPLTMQVKLLRVLQEKKILRVGGTREIPIDCRILAATNRDLKDEVARGTFRKDLYYRINVVSLFIPPLRERRNDIPLLISHFLAKHPATDGKVKTISADALDFLTAYEYPGNVRELENIIERSLALCNEDEIKVRHLPPDLPGHDTPATVPTTPAHSDLHSLEEHERNYILSVLKSVDGNRSKAARIMGIDRVSLWRKLKKYQDQGLDLDQYLGRY
ncbi:sigma-54-dependent transcriptional regulator [Desulfolithobacter sp.]